LSSTFGGTRTAAGSNLATHKSTRSRNFGPESFIHFSACRAIAASNSRMTSSSTFSVRAMIVETIRKSIVPRTNTLATCGNRSRNVRP
jgi:hypothetical protein